MIKTQSSLEKNAESLTDVGGSSYTDVLKRERASKKSIVRREKTPKEYVREILGEVDEIIDELFARKKKIVFNISAWLSEKKATSDHVDIIRATYTKERDEIIGALNGADQDLVEGYRFLNTKQKEIVVDFYDSLIEGLSDFTNLIKRKKALGRKPRVSKPIAASKQVKALKFLRESDEFGIVSVAPEHLIGASEAWVFNVKTRKLSKYVAADRGGFKAKGCSLLNFNEKESVTLTLRKPDEVLKVVVSAKKRELNKIIDGLTTKPTPANGRFNSSTVILTTIK